MPVMISLLRGVNVGGHNQIKMEALRSLYSSLKLQNAQTYVQSGNVVFGATDRGLARLANRIEEAIEDKFGFRPDVILRSVAELRAVVAANPFAKRRDIHPGKLLVTFLAAEPRPEGFAAVRKLKTDPEELHLRAREAYIYFPNGAGRSKFPWANLGKLLGVPATARNWNTVLKLLELAESMDASG